MKMSIEKEFQIAEFKVRVANLTPEEAKELLIHLFEAKINMEAVYKDMLQKHWQV